MDASPFGSPSRQPVLEPATPPSTQDFARHTSFIPSGIVTPTPSARTDVPLLPTNNPIPPVPTMHEKYSPKPIMIRVLRKINEVLLGKEKASVYWYASLMSVLAALVVTGSSIFGWPPLPIWEYLRHATG
ncbi:hypothetical protein F5144DRAFT_230636 [Chaetomium tenue]|uniref:Uncharacterized protein n=1 Tax=Chaetomium tenue TaxID=1854479 RepID=A0ACB7P744_9PEZI|nr:hypothetical protein F5144DRAFT_230636 [Chaetomium globosum]